MHDESWNPEVEMPPLGMEPGWSESTLSGDPLPELEELALAELEELGLPPLEDPEGLSEIGDEPSPPDVDLPLPEEPPLPDLGGGMVSFEAMGGDFAVPPPPPVGFEATGGDMVLPPESSLGLEADFGLPTPGGLGLGGEVPMLGDEPISAGGGIVGPAEPPGLIGLPPEVPGLDPGVDVQVDTGASAEDLGKPGRRYRIVTTVEIPERDG